MRSLFAIVFLLVSFSCTTERSDPSYVIFSGTAQGFENDSIQITTQKRFRYFDQPEVEHSFPIAGNNNFRDTLELEEGHYELRLGDKKVNLFLKPGYELQVELNSGALNFNGKGSVENNYIQERDSLISLVGRNNFYQYFSQLPEREFLQYADSLEQQRLDLIEGHKGIDDHLAKTETLWARVEKAHKFHNYSFTRETVDTSYIPGPAYPDPMAALNVNDENLLHVSLYPMLLYSHYGKIARENNLEEWEYILQDSFPVSNPKVREVALYTTAKFSMNRFEKLDEFYTGSQDFLENEKYREEITVKYLDLKNLSKGKPAPLFVLNNMKEEPVSLEQFRGKLVFLDFWSTSCRPCIEEMPAFNKLQEEFKGKDVAFISIGITSSREGLERIIEKNNFSGIHLYDPPKEEELTKNYAVTGIPRYVLIDKEGKIIDYMAKRPSDPALAGELKAYLK